MRFLKSKSGQARMVLKSYPHDVLGSSMLKVLSVVITDAICTGVLKSTGATCGYYGSTPLVLGMPLMNSERKKPEGL